MLCILHKPKVMESSRSDVKRYCVVSPVQFHMSYLASQIHPFNELYYYFHSAEPYEPIHIAVPNRVARLRPPHTPWPKASCPIVHSTSIHYSDSLSGPWLNAGAIKMAPNMPSYLAASNPAPLIFPNGIVRRSIVMKIMWQTRVCSILHAFA